nr:T-complex protein 1 subunit zeta 1 [Andalucia godoyi]
MSAVQFLNNGAEVARKTHALTINISAAKGLMEVLKSNLGPKGTMKMLVSGAGEIKMTKDGSVLLKEMQIQHPTAMMIARTATAQDDETGDGTTTAVLLTGETLKQCERFLAEGVHPRVLNEGLEQARMAALEFLETFTVKVPSIESDPSASRSMLMNIARCAMATKVQAELVEQLSTMVVDAVNAIRPAKISTANSANAGVDETIDLFMVEIMTMQHRLDSDSRLVRGIVMDHGSRHPGMPARLENCFVLTCNINLEWERSEVQAQFTYQTADKREKMVASERKVTDDRVRRIIELKREVCATKPGSNFVIVNQGGIDPISLDMLAKENILALRRAKRRNMERLTKACGGNAVNALEDLKASDLGWAGIVYEQTLGEDKFTFVEECLNPRSVTILLKGPNKYTINQIQDAVRDGLRAVKNTIEDTRVVPGGGAFETACSLHLQKLADATPGRAKRGIQAFAEALLIVPKTLASNAGRDHEEAILQLVDTHRQGLAAALDGFSGECVDPVQAGILDNYRVKRQILTAAPSIASQLLLVDEIMRAGRGTAPRN